jgi:hypothetical protein
MAQNGLHGPFSLTDEVIDREVGRSQPGAYALEESADLVNFRVVYVGRSDSDVNNQLHVHVGSYKRFRYESCSSPEAAFQRECALYHDFEPRDNPIHPQRPTGAKWTCPRCGLFS